MPELTIREIAKSVGEAVDGDEPNDDAVVSALEPFFERWSEIDWLAGLREGEANKVKADIRGLMVAAYQLGQMREHDEFLDVLARMGNPMGRPA